MTRYTLASDWESIDQYSDPSRREKDRIAELFNTTKWTYVVWIPEWLADQKQELESLEKFYRLFVGELEDHSQKAWRLWQPHRNNGVNEPNEFLPKSQVIVFERARGKEIERPQAAISSFSKGDEQ